MQLRPRRAAALVAGLLLLVLPAASASAASGELTFHEFHQGEAGLTGARGVAVSPDGANVYVAGQDADAVVMYVRTAGGGLTNVGCIKDTGAPGACGASTEGLDSARFIAVSPDGRHVYVTGGDDDAVVIFTRGPGGGLTPVGCWRDTRSGAACAAGMTAGLDGAEGIAVSPDGRNVYVAGQNQSTLVTFARDLSSGTLSAPSCIQDSSSAAGCSTVTGSLRAPRELAIAPDGRGVYVAAASSDAVAAFLRNPATGTLTPAVAGSGIGLPVGVTVSPDGAQVYAGGVTSRAVVIFSRDPATASLTPAGCVKDVGAAASCATSAEGLGGVEGVAVSPDGANLYAAGLSDSAVVALTRSPLGALGTLGCLRDAPGGGGCGVGNGLGGARGVAISPDGANVYVTGSGEAAVAVLDRAAPPAGGGGGGGGGGQPPTPTYPPACLDATTLLATCAGIIPAICGPSGTIFPQCSMPVPLPVVCGPSNTLLVACQGRGPYVMACGGVGTILPVCSHPPPQLPQVCGPSNTLLPPCTGGNNQITVCGPSTTIVPACNFGRPIDASVLDPGRGTGTIDLSLQCPPGGGQSARAAAAGAHAAAEPRRRGTCTAFVNVEALRIAKIAALRRLALFLGNAVSERASHHNDLIVQATGLTVAEINKFHEANRQVFITRAERIIQRWFAPGDLPPTSSSNVLGPLRGVVASEMSGPGDPRYVGPGVLFGPTPVYVQFANAIHDDFNEYRRLYLASRRGGGASAALAAAAGGPAAHAAARGRTAFGRRFRLPRRGGKRTVRLQLPPSVVRGLVRSVGRRARFVPVRVVISFAAKPRPLVRVVDIPMRIERRAARARRRGRARR